MTTPTVRSVTPFEKFMALAFPWLHPDGADWRNMRAAFDAGWKAAQEQRE